MDTQEIRHGGHLLHLPFVRIHATPSPLITPAVMHFSCLSVYVSVCYMDTCL